MRDTEMKQKSENVVSEDIEKQITEAEEESIDHNYVPQLNAGRKKEDEDEPDEFDEDDVDNDEEEEEDEENPFDREPTDEETIDNDLPFIDPEEDLFDGEDEFPL